MRIFRHFVANDKGSSFESFALIAAVVALAAVASADFMDRSSKTGASPLLAYFKSDSDLGARSRNAPRPNGYATTHPNGNIDNTPTATIIQRSVLDPCTGKTK